MDIVREAVAVLAAILVAFGLDAWWESRVERASMLDALEAVAVEIGRNVTQLDSAVALNRRQIEVAQALARATEAEIAGLTPEEVGRYSRFPEHEILTLESGALTAFIQGGFLQAMSDGELRAVVAGIATVQDELDEEREGFHAMDVRTIEAVLMRIPLEDLLEQGDVDGARSMLRAIVADEDARRLIFARSFLLSIYTDEMSRLRRRLSESLEAVRAGLRS
ncbi:MAG: hypothetical protein R3195_20745 [Gemmatimonadota bacterium]|nr:hypothetical protein [Gemmatimonadota bacterium]